MVKSAITIGAFVVMNGAGFVGYRAMSGSAPRAAPAAVQVTPLVREAPARAEPVQPAARVEVRPAPEEIVVEALDDNAVADDPTDAGAATTEPSASSMPRKSRRDEPRRATRPHVEPAAPVAAPTARPAPAPAPAAPAPAPAAPDPKQRLLEEMESNPYKRSD